VAHVGLAGIRTHNPQSSWLLEPMMPSGLMLSPLDAYFVAAQLAEVIKNNPYDIILCGIESSDYNGSTVGGMLAEFLELPSVSAVSSFAFENGKLTLNRELDGGKEIMTVPSPFVAIVQKGIAKEPRIAAMRGL
jgi:electron transfer flavoprotein beta subunit